jgi:HEAT repeat protein
MSAFALRMIRPEPKKSVPALARLLADKDEDVRNAACSALVWFMADAKLAVPVLIEILGENPDGQVRLMAAEKLGDIGPAAKEAVPALEKARQDKDEKVRKAAGEALEAIRGEAKKKDQGAQEP